MQARVARYEVSPERCDDAVEAFLGSARDIIEMDGFQSGYLLVNSETGETVTVTFWESQATADASATRAASLRRRAIAAVEGDVSSVQGFDVVRNFGD
jgi:heme-degrading monooxygenase HmoA